MSHTTKTCGLCKTEKPIEEFGKNRRTKDGLNGRCKPCHNAAWKKWAAENPEKVRESSARYSKTPAGKASKKMSDAKYYENNHAQVRAMQIDSRLRHRYGISLEQYNQMVAERNGLCDICGKEPVGKSVRSSKLHVDHCHETNEVRGLLCTVCNQRLGILEIREFVESAEAYLARSKV